MTISQAQAIAAGVPRSDGASLFERFRAEIYPLLERGGVDGCIGCHDASTNADLQFIGDPRDDFKMLLEGGYFEGERPDSLLARIQSKNPKRRMPKGQKARLWASEEIQRLELFSARIKDGLLAPGDDESFPPSLLEAFRGEENETTHTQFLSYTQLKGKIQALFEDSWVREGEDLFKANVALFGGADFESRFNESTQASSGFMSALRRMAKDVAERAYVSRSGPFATDRFWNLAEDDQREAMHFLYTCLLHRRASVHEIELGEALYESIRAHSQELNSSAFDLSFSVEAIDPASGLSASREISIPVRAGNRRVTQQLLQLPVGASKEGAATTRIDKAVPLQPGLGGQECLLHTKGVLGPVSFVGLLLEHSEGATVEWIGVKDSRVELNGAWKLSEKNGYWSADLDSAGIAENEIAIPLDPDFEGAYRITAFWRPQKISARDVLVEVWHSGTGAELAVKAEGPARGEASVSLSFDGTIDTQAYVDFEPSFRFGEKGYVEINNYGTRNKVAIGPLEFRGSGGERFEIDTKEAEGFDQWSPFRAIAFNAYNARGTRVEDQNKRKGELFLRYRPSALSSGAWDPERFYQLRAFYPGKRDHDHQIPVSVHAEASSPILKLKHPLRASRGSRVVLDASETFTVQESDLDIRWQQVGGIPVGDLDHSARLEFDVPVSGEAFHFWTALTQGLIRHPDFLFTRAPALDWVAEESQRRRLMVSRVALDLVGRSPTPHEVDGFLSDWDWGKVVDYYLASEDFRRFYHHRIRLYLESQGTVEQDEPVRLWCYVAFNDLPFQKILTSAFTVNPAMQKETRPAYHGRTGVLTTPGFIAGKPGLPHYNYAAQVSMLFLGYRYEVPPDIVEQREGVTALGTTDPNSACYGCHKILTPLAFQRNFWTDAGKFRLHDEYGLPIEASDQGMVAEYPFKGEGLEAFALQAVKKERFIRTVIDTHFDFLFGRSMRYRTDERTLYKRLWDEVHENGFKIRGLMRAIATSPEYCEAP